MAEHKVKPVIPISPWNNRTEAAEMSSAGLKGMGRDASWHY